MNKTTHFLWDYNIDEKTFREILSGQKELGNLDKNWASTRLIEYGKYEEIIAMIGYKNLVNNWHIWREKIRSISRKRGLDWLVEWLPKYHPDLL